MGWPLIDQFVGLSKLKKKKKYARTVSFNRVLSFYLLARMFYIQTLWADGSAGGEDKENVPPFY